MKKKIILITSVLALVLAAVSFSSCSQWDTPYTGLENEGYNVSVRFDANGGTFASIEGDTYVVDVFKYEDAEDTAKGKALSLVAPDDEARGNNAYPVSRAGYFLAGWYATRTEAGTDGEGNTLYNYSDKWDFGTDKLVLDPDKTYTATENALTLYAKWIPYFTFEIYAKDESGAFVKVTEDKNAVELRLPYWDDANKKTKITMNNFPERPGYTFVAAYTDEAMTERVTDSITGTYDPLTGVADDLVIELYTEWQVGDWYKIYSVKDFRDNARPSGCFDIKADLDFTDVTWPSSLTTATFTGKILGNGHTFSNITAAQTDGRASTGGIFGAIAASAVIENVSFENLTYTAKGSTTNGASFGLFTGSVAEGASLTNVSVSGTLKIDALIVDAINKRNVYLLSGDGGTHGIDVSGITACLAAPRTDGKVIVISEAGKVTLASAVTE